MSRRTTAIAAAISLLPLGQPLLLGSTTALATTAVVLSNQAAVAQSAAYATYYNSGLFMKGSEVLASVYGTNPNTFNFAVQSDGVDNVYI